MSFWNPWSELRELKSRLASEEAAYAEEETAQQKELAALRESNRELSIKFRAADMQAGIYAMQMKSMHRRDPKTGRILPRGK